MSPSRPFETPRRRRPRSPLAAALVVVLALLYTGYQAWVRPSPRPLEPPASAEAATSDGEILRLFEERRSNVWVEAEGEVTRLLADDLRGSRHQRLILRLANGHTLLVSHNIDLARRVPVKPGERLRLRGEYEWNDKGGVVHWTHHDPKQRTEGGWIRHRDQLYR